MVFRHIGTAVLLASSCLASAAFAQTVTPPATTAEDDRGSGLEDIVVTAQKRSENLQTTPVSVTAITTERLESAGISDTTRLQNFVPGLQATRGGLQVVLFLRGIGNNSGVPGNEAAISTYVDGVYRASPSGSDFSFNNIERVEVLKGPQGTLFGRNAAGGVINIITKDPSHEPTVSGSLGYSSFNTFSATGYASAGLSDTVAIDVSAQYSKQNDGWGTNLFNGHDAYLNDNFAIRSKLLFTPSDLTRITLIGDAASTRSDVGANYVVTPPTLSNTGVAHQGGFYDTSADFDPNNRIRQVGVSGKIEQDLGGARLTSITAWRQTRSAAYQNVDATALPTFRQAAFVLQRTFTEELNVASDAASRIKWIAGLYYFNDSAGYQPYYQIGTQFGSANGGIATTASQKTLSYAGYGQVTVPLGSEATHVTLGGRYTSDKRTPSGSRVSYPAGTPITLVYPANYPTESKADRFTYRLSLDHSFSPDVFAYATLSTGFKSGNYNVAGINQLPTSAITITAYEAGIKSELFDHTVRLNLAAFHYDYNNLQVQAYTATGPVLTNAAKARFNGIDAELTIAPTRELMINSSLNYTDAHYVDFANAVCTFPLPAGGYSGSVTCNATGNQVALSNPLTISNSISYTVETGSGSLQLVGDMSYQHSYFFDVQNSIKQNAYTLFGAQISWTTRDEHWTFALFGRNLTKEKYYANRTLTAGFGDAYTPGSPRVFGGRVSFKY